jgi:hypothetical protein
MPLVSILLLKVQTQCIRSVEKRIKCVVKIKTISPLFEIISFPSLKKVIRDWRDIEIFAAAVLKLLKCWNLICAVPSPVAARSKALGCGRSLAGMWVRIPRGTMDACLLWLLCVFRQRLCEEPTTRPEKSYRQWCVWMWPYFGPRTIMRETRWLRLMADWISGQRYAACPRAKRYDYGAMRVVRQNDVPVF